MRHCESHRQSVHLLVGHSFGPPRCRGGSSDASHMVVAEAETAGSNAQAHLR